MLSTRGRYVARRLGRPSDSPLPLSSAPLPPRGEVRTRRTRMYPLQHPLAPLPCREVCGCNTRLINSGRAGRLAFRPRPTLSSHPPLPSPYLPNPCQTEAPCVLPGKQQREQVPRGGAGHHGSRQDGGANLVVGTDGGVRLKSMSHLSALQTMPL